MDVEGRPKKNQKTNIALCLFTCQHFAVFVLTTCTLATPAFACWHSKPWFAWAICLLVVHLSLTKILDFTEILAYQTASIFRDLLYCLDFNFNPETHSFVL